MSSRSGILTTAAAHPFKIEHRDLDLPVGMTLFEILEAVQPDPVLRKYAHIFLEDEKVGRDRWHIRPREGQRVLINVVPMGGGEGGKNPLRIILSIAILVVGTVLGGPLGIALGLGKSAAAGAIGSAIITIGGTLLLNAIAPIRPSSIHQQDRDSPNYFIDQARNRARPFQAIPTVLGRHRMVPPLGASVFTEALGDKQWLRMLVIWGYGPLAISDLRIGETPITDFDDVEVETREGRAGEPPLTIYTNDVNEQRLSIELTAAAGWFTRVTGADADEISIDITFPQGVAGLDDNGRRRALSVAFEVQYREVGETDWLRPRFFASGGASTINAALETHTVGTSTVTLRYNRTSPIREGLRWSVPSRAQYEVHIRRITPDRTAVRETDSSYWTALRSFTDRDPIAFGIPLARTAISIRATDQLSGAVDQLNAIVASHVPDWDGSAWVERESSNPASLYRHALQGPARDKPTPDTQVGLVALRDWHDFCESNGYEYNAIRDFQASLHDALADIASTGRASPSYADGKWSVVVDDGIQIPVQHFTPRNSSNFTAERHFEPAPHALRIRFSNRDEGWRRDEQIVYRDGFDESNAENFFSLEAPGITDSDHIYRFGRFHLAQILLRREVWSFDVDFEYIVAVRGNRVLVTHDVLLVGQKSARIKHVSFNSAGEAIGIEIDEQVSMTAGLEYGVSIRTADDAGIPSRVDTVPGETTTLVFTTPIPVSTPIGVGDLLAFGEFGRETIDGIVVSIEPSTDLSASISVMPWSGPGVYDSETGPIPPYDSRLTPLAGREALEVLSVNSGQNALVLEGGVLVPRIVVEVKPIQDDRVVIDCQIRASGTLEPYHNAEIASQTPESVIVSGVEDESTYDLRLRWRVPGTVLPGPWTDIIGHRVVGRPDPPPALSGLALHSWGENSVLIRWDPIAAAELRSGGQVRFRHSEASANPTWGDAISVGEPIGRESYAILPFKPGWYLARVFDADEDGSAVVFISATAPQLLDYANLVTRMESPSFPGVKTDVEVNGTALVLSSGEEEGTYQFEDNIDIGSSKQVRITSVLSVSGTDNTDAFVEFRTTPDDPDDSAAVWSDWRRLDTEQIEARGFEVRLQVVRSGSDTIQITDLGAAVDEPITTGINWRGPWAVGIDFSTLDAVSRNNAAWVCIQPHTSAADNAPGTVGGDAYWDLLIDSFRWRGPWQSGQQYVTQDITSNDGRSWVSLGDHLSSSANEPTEDNGGGVFWDLLADVGVAGNDGHGFEWRGAWAVGITYLNTDLLQDLVSHNRQSFVCLVSHVSTAATEPGTAGGATYWALLAGVEVDTRRPDAPGLTLASTGLSTDDFYAFLAGVILSSGLGAVSVDQTQIQVSTTATGHTVSNGWDNPLQDLLFARPPIAQTLLVVEYGTYHISARVRNGVTNEWSQWSAPISALTVRSVADTGLASAPVLRAVRPDPDGDAVELIIERPLSNFQTLWSYNIQANTGATGPVALPANRDYATGVRSVQASGSGTIVPGGRILTAAGSPGWTVNEYAGKILYVYRTSLTDFATGAVEFPHAFVILSNTAGTITLRPGSSFAAAFTDPSNLTFAFLIADTWLRVPEDLVTNQSLTLREEGAGSVQEIPLETNHQILLSEEAWVRVRGPNLFGYGPWSARVMVPAPGTPAGPSVVLTASSLSITPGSSVTLSWMSTNGVSASIDQGVGNVTPVAGGSVEVTPASSRTYQITVVGAEGTTPATASVTITVLTPDDDPPTIDSFTASPSSITLGATVALAWTTTDATSVEIRVFVGLSLEATLTSQSLDGSTTVTPSFAGVWIFKLRATNAEGNATDSETVTVNPVDDPDPPDPPVDPDPVLPTIDSFSVSPSTIDLGDSVTVSWQTTGATSVVVERGNDQGPFGFSYSTISSSLDGSTTNTPSTTLWKRFRIRATNSDGTVTRTINITINNP